MKKLAFLLSVLVLCAIIPASNVSIPPSVQVAMLDTDGDYMFDFSSYSHTSDWNQSDISMEPWDLPGLCGMWQDMGPTPFDSVTTAPQSGYLNEGEDWVDCDYIAEGHTYVVKTTEGHYAKFHVEELTHGDSAYGGFRNTMIITYYYQPNGSNDLVPPSGGGMGPDMLCGPFSILNQASKDLAPPPLCCMSPKVIVLFAGLVGLVLFKV